MVEFQLPQTGKPELSPISLSLHLMFLREHRSGFDKMTEGKQFEIEQAFSKGYEDLSAERQQQVGKYIEGITLEIQGLPQLHPGLAIIRRDRIGEGIIDVLESCGIVDSASPGGVEFIRKMLSAGAPNVSEELSIEEKDIKAQTLRSIDPETKIVADSLLTLKEAILSELDRLKLIPEDPETTQNKKANGELNQLYGYVPDELKSLSPWLKGAILDKGLIGFSTLDRLIDKFFQIRHWLNKM